MSFLEFRSYDETKQSDSDADLWTVVDEVERSDAESDSSSVVYDHEPFDIFRVRVLEFAQSLWNEPSPESFTIFRMKGGGFNRIIGISRKVSSKEKEDEFILRIPRFDAARLDRDVAALRFVQNLGTIPVADVVSFDETRDNKLQHPYMIQNRILGTDLYCTYPRLVHEDKCKIATDLGDIFHRMLSAKTSKAGLFSLFSAESQTGEEPGEIIITPFYEAGASSSSQDPLVHTTLELLQTTFEARKNDGLEQYPSDTLRPKLFDQFVTMASEMDAGDLFKDNEVSLCHLDLAPRNILIGHAPDSVKLAIVGVLDWDSAASAPSFMSCAPPLWIWAWSDDEDEDERTANDVPATKEQQMLKRAFEEAAGPRYMHYAYRPAYRLARRLCRFAIDGIRSAEDVDEAEEMLHEWHEMRDTSPQVI
jgi:aminoglycoside phosphotransferase (APT) family kinase protein